MEVIIKRNARKRIKADLTIVLLSAGGLMTLKGYVSTTKLKENPDITGVAYQYKGTIVSKRVF